MFNHLKYRGSCLLCVLNCWVVYFLFYEATISLSPTVQDHFHMLSALSVISITHLCLDFSDLIKTHDISNVKVRMQNENLSIPLSTLLLIYTCMHKCFKAFHHQFSASQKPLSSSCWLTKRMKFQCAHRD